MQGQDASVKQVITVAITITLQHYTNPLSLPRLSNYERADGTFHDPLWNLGDTFVSSKQTAESANKCKRFLRWLSQQDASSPVQVFPDEKHHAFAPTIRKSNSASHRIYVFVDSITYQNPREKSTAVCRKNYRELTAEGNASYDVCFLIKTSVNKWYSWEFYTTNNSCPWDNGPTDQTRPDQNKTKGNPIQRKHWPSLCLPWKKCSKVIKNISWDVIMKSSNL